MLEHVVKLRPHWRGSARVSNDDAVGLHKDAQEDVDEQYRHDDEPAPEEELQDPWRVRGVRHLLVELRGVHREHCIKEHL